MWYIMGDLTSELVGCLDKVFLKKQNLHLVRALQVFMSISNPYTLSLLTISISIGNSWKLFYRLEIQQKREETFIVNVAHIA